MPLRTFEPEHDSALINLISDRRDALFARVGGSVTVQGKESSWEELRTVFNTQYGMSITKQQLTAKWKNLKSKLNKYCDKVRKEREATGGGPSTPPDPAMEKLWDVFGRDCPTLNKVKNARTSISGMSVTSRTAEGSQPNGTGSTPQQDGPPALGIALVPSPGELPDLGGSNGNIPLLGDEFLIELEALDLEKALREIQLQTADSEKAARHAEVLERDARRSAAMAEVTAWEEQALYYRAKRLRISPE
ncbi:hypothetical protein FOZ62_020061 [Perkinsus olseni]|uniref:Myb/SANT-like DNA-binding domain-containing protein n=1 Tax=Perkinsus olseni TaxID=32597 RepID=A0A7J6S9T9_PEROL|nr:hypothetical protein FOZ62_020061 [Perkinsus olseni]